MGGGGASAFCWEGAFEKWGGFEGEERKPDVLGKLAGPQSMSGR